MLSAHRASPDRSVTLITHKPMYTKCTRGPGLPNANDVARNIPSSIQHIVVMCDGSPSGDRALRLADAISRSTGASVRAVTWLPDGYSLDGEAPIENFHASVTRQLYRVTTMIGFWRLELLTGRVDQQLARLCSRESAQLFIVPYSRTPGKRDPQSTVVAGVPVVCVFQDSSACGERVVLYARADPASRRDAEVAAAVITASHTMHAMIDRSSHRGAKPSCPYVRVQTVTAAAPYLAAAHSSSNSLSLTAS